MAPEHTQAQHTKSHLFGATTDSNIAQDHPQQAQYSRSGLFATAAYSGMAPEHSQQAQTAKTGLFATTTYSGIAPEYSQLAQTAKSGLFATASYSGMVPEHPQQAHTMKTAPSVLPIMAHPVPAPEHSQQAHSLGAACGVQPTPSQYGFGLDNPQVSSLKTVPGLHFGPDAVREDFARFPQGREGVHPLSYTGNINQTCQNGLQHSTYLSEQEKRASSKASDSLGESWRRKGHAPFTGSQDPNLPLASLLRKWQNHVSQEWREISAPESVKAFHTSALSQSLSEEVRKAGNCGDINTREYYKRLWEHTVAHLSRFHDNANYTTLIIQRLLGQKQACGIFEHLDMVQDLLREVCFTTSDDGGINCRLHPSHVANAIRGNLIAPFNQWWYTAMKTLSGARPPVLHSYDQLQQAICMVKEEALALGYSSLRGAPRQSLAPSNLYHAPTANQAAGGNSISTSFPVGVSSPPSGSQAFYTDVPYGTEAGPTFSTGVTQTTAGGQPIIAAVTHTPNGTFMSPDGLIHYHNGASTCAVSNVYAPYSASALAANTSLYTGGASNVAAASPSGTTNLSTSPGTSATASSSTSAGGTTKKRLSCRRCWASGHKDTECNVKEPKNKDRRCPCGSTRHLGNECPIAKDGAAGLLCARCSARSHRSGMCPWSLDDIAAKKHIPGTSSREGTLGESNFLSVPLEELRFDGSFAFHVAAIPRDNSTRHPGQVLNKPVSTKIQVSSRLLATAILDSGSGKNLARTSTIQAIEASPGSKVEWESVPPGESPAIRGISGEMLCTHRIAWLVVHSPRRPHDVVRLRFFVSDDILPVLLIGVEGMRDMRMALTFTPDTVRAYSGIQEEQSIARVEETRPPTSLTPLVDKQEEQPDITAYIIEDQFDVDQSLFDGAAFLQLAAESELPFYDEPYTQLDQDFCYDLYAGSGNPSLPCHPSFVGGPSLVQALTSPDCSFRGLSQDGGTTRFLHEFAWIQSRPSPSKNNYHSARKRAEKLADSLAKRGLLDDYTEVFEGYLKDDLIVKVNEQEVHSVVFTNHFPVVKEANVGTATVGKTEAKQQGRKTKIRPVFDWRVGNKCQRTGVVMDRCMWPFLATTRLYPHAVWCDLRTAFLRCHVTVKTSKCFGFVHATAREDGSYNYHYYRFRGLCMGNKGSPAALQLSAGLLEAMANEESARRLTGDDTDRPIYRAIKDCLVHDSEVEGLEPDQLVRPSPAAIQLKATLEHVQCNNIKIFTAQQENMPAREGLKDAKRPEEQGPAVLHVDAYDTSLIDAYHNTISLSTVLYLGGGRRGRYMDDWAIGAKTQAMADDMYAGDCVLAEEFGHEFAPRKTKKSWQPTEAEGMGLVWTSDDSLKCKPVDLAKFRRVCSMNGGRLSIREVLSALHSCHDPLGHLGWSTLGMKRILRIAYVAAKSMDDRLNMEDSRASIDLLNDFNRAVEEAPVPRYVDLNVGVALYTDASTYALGTYICGLETVNIPYVCSSRLVPLGSVGFSIVRKEQLALEWGLESICAHMVLFPHSPNRHFYILTDSKIVHYRVSKLLKVALTVDGPSKLLKYPKSWTQWEFAHAKRCAMMLKAIGTLVGSHGKVHFRHCPSQFNLADAYSRGSSPSTLDWASAQKWVNQLHNAVGSVQEPEVSQASVEVEADVLCYISDVKKEVLDDIVDDDIQGLICRAQLSDSYCQAVRFICSGKEQAGSPQVDIRDYTNADRSKLRATFEVDDDGIIRLSVGRAPGHKGPLLVPVGVQQQVLAQYHEFFCHRPPRDLHTALVHKVYWRHLKRDVRRFSQSCPSCQRSKGVSIHTDTHPSAMGRDFSINECIAIDWLGGVRDDDEDNCDPIGIVGHKRLGSSGFQPRFALHIVDLLTRHHTFLLAEDKSAASAQELVEHYCLVYGYPKLVLSDADSSFTGRHFSSWCRTTGIKQAYSPPYAPFRRGHIERAHAEVWASVRAMKDEARTRGYPPKPWYCYIQRIAFALNNTASEQLGGFSPNDLVYTYQTSLPPALLADKKLPEDLQNYIDKNLVPEEHHDQRYQGFVEKFRREFEAALSLYRGHLMKVLHENSLRAASKSQRRLKTKARWTGPVKVKGNSSASKQLVDIETLSGRPLGRVHVFNVKRAYLSTQQQSLLQQLASGDDQGVVTAGTAPEVVSDLPPVHSTMFPDAHYVLGRSVEDKTPVVHISLVKEPVDTGLWIQTDCCDLWVQCPQTVFDRYKDESFRCVDVGLNCPLS
ncbi:gag/pol/env polyprotein, putative [Perkinsus marinus ATCC 50983]|uniref:Gag/pol/env polyprotein, putative n=1 Tax=Perkinsus marinus (strain ATCC 50983 / TXsc) TaxID=423536 RepID=C5KX67_PERM5|nr:gag/pol/env polyprotein, putative [Perkinsus marinus ATCC 50983]EER10923.1 gag/pol/env polyprotein, putative [Perkinsus marinus ATCC 50983]|eukprot:XP_002779128.1 gag/pol/env polyprotein, putative [Perkinsus marinus ATCC 50983]